MRVGWALFNSAGIGAGRFQGRHHIIRRDDRRVEGDRIDLPPQPPSAGHIFDTVQPFQGCFAHVVSMDVEDNFGQCRFGHGWRDGAYHGDGQEQ